MPSLHLPELIGYLGACVAVYAGIRADLASLRAKIEATSASTERAHARIDQLITTRS